MNIVFSPSKRRPGCVLLQAGMGGTVPSLEFQRFFPPSTWLVAPTDDMGPYPVDEEYSLEVLSEMAHDAVTPGCPRHPESFSRGCRDVRCQDNWEIKGAPTPDEQLARWAAGDAVCPNSKHNCCPDFACCVMREDSWSLDKRAKFVAADQGTREKMMMGALGGLIDKTSDKKVYVTRGEPTDNE